MVTQQDVARLAGTSVAVVSYVVNNGPRPVADATRERVLAAIAELSFRPNRAARSLRVGKSHVIGLVIPDSSHPFFADIARKVEEVAYGRGYVIFTGNSLNEEAREDEYFALFREHQVDGLLLTVNPVASIDEVAKAGIPIVLLDQPAAESELHAVFVDYEGAARDGTAELIAGGHTTIAFVGGERGLPSAEARRDGWLSAVGAAGLRADLETAGPFSRENGYRAGLDLLQRADRPTAAFIASDQQAIGFLRAATELGVRSPDDLWVIAFDDSDDSLYTNPQLSAVRQPVEAMVTRAIDILLDPPADVVREIFPHEIVRRLSTGAGQVPPPDVPSERRLG